MTREEAIKVLKNTVGNIKYDTKREEIYFTHEWVGAYEMAISALMEQCVRDVTKTCETCYGNDMAPDETDNPCWNCKGDHSEWYPREQEPVTDSHRSETVTNRNGLNRWISVEERLPEDLPENEGKKVIPCLVSLKSCYPNGKPNTQKRQRQLQYYGSAGYVWEWSRIGASRVTHWMPLPEPPEVEV